MPAGLWGSRGRQGAAGDKQGGDAQPLLSLQCPSSCWRRWALTPQTPSCSRTICTVTWGEDYAKSTMSMPGGTKLSMACLHVQYPPLARALQLHRSIAVPWLKPPTSWCPGAGEMCSAGRGGAAGEHPGGQGSASAGRKEFSVGKETGGDRQPGSGVLGGTSCLSPPPLVRCRWLVQRAQVLQAPGRPDDFY